MKTTFTMFFAPLLFAASRSAATFYSAAGNAAPATSPTRVAQEAAKKVGAAMVKNDVRYVVVEVENTDGNPCMPAGKSLQAGRAEA